MPAPSKQWFQITFGVFSHLKKNGQNVKNAISKITANGDKNISPFAKSNCFFMVWGARSSLAVGNFSRRGNTGVEMPEEHRVHRLSVATIHQIFDGAFRSPCCGRASQGISQGTTGCRAEPSRGCRARATMSGKLRRPCSLPAGGSGGGLRCGECRGRWGAGKKRVEHAFNSSFGC